MIWSACRAPTPGSSRSAARSSDSIQCALVELDAASPAQVVTAVSPDAPGTATVCVDFACVAARCVTVALVGSGDVLDAIRFDRDPDTLAMNCQALPFTAFFPSSGKRRLSARC